MKMLVSLKPHFPCNLPYTALRLRDDITHSMKGGAKCHLTHEMTSQTAEHYGVIGLITMIIVLNTKYGQPNGNTTIEVWIDNAEVLRRLNIGRENMLKLADYEVADYTLWCIMSEAYTMVPPNIKISFQKV